MVEIRPANTPASLKTFIELPLSLYRDDPFYVPQLTRELKVHFSEKNPFFRHAKVKFFLALKGGKPVGRIASIIDRLHNDLHKDRTGFFGFFESINNPEVAAALLGRVAEDLKGNGMNLMRGPMNFSTNEECGVLMEGFDAPPMLMMPYNHPWYTDLLAGYGMTKAKDLNAYIHHVIGALPEKVLRVAAIAEKKGITVRPIRKKEFEQDMMIFKEIYNAAWAHNWGFIPISDEELIYSADRLKQIVEQDLTVIAEKDGEPVGFLGMVPDFNFVLRRMGGRLTPVTILKALYHSRRITDLRLLLLGIKPEYRNRGVDALMFREVYEGVKRYKRIEFSWILEDNLPVIRIIEMVGGDLYRRYRIFEKSIG
ncbi:MAG: hypothetical protein WC291_02715 [Thermodesulfovibrionales bacterium]|jgi:GNAT superfamily N-acetyltransferase